MAGKLALRFVALAYIAAILALPVGMIFYRSFDHGIVAAWQAVMQPDALHALWLTLLIAAITVPLNTVFGILCALLLVRSKFWFARIIDVLIDLPFAVSPVVVGLALVLVYGRQGWFGPWLAAHDIRVIFALPGMVLATVFVSLPFVVREVVPVLREAGEDQEQAARTLGASPWQTFWRVTLPSIRWGVTYGVVLTTARALGEFGAVSVVAGHLAGVTQTLTLYVDDRFEAFDLTGAYVASVVLALLAFATLFSMNALARKEA
jgi:sulfate transport system permease protein